MINCLEISTYFVNTRLNNSILDNAFSRGRLYYSSLRLEPDSGSLYVGAMNNVFRLWLYNVNDTEQRSLVSTHYRDDDKRVGWISDGNIGV
jgi:hypothetical protein